MQNIKKLLLTSICAFSLVTLATLPAIRTHGIQPRHQPAHHHHTRHHGPHRNPHHRPSTHHEHKQKMEDRITALESQLTALTIENEALKAELANVKVKIKREK